MNRSTTVFLINSKVRAFNGIYEPGGKVEVFKSFDETIKKGDLVVVTTDTRFNFTVGKCRRCGLLPGVNRIDRAGRKPRVPKCR